MLKCKMNKMLIWQKYKKFSNMRARAAKLYSKTSRLAEIYD